MPDVRIHSPYLSDSSSLWLRGNLHTHTTRSDGTLSPLDTIRLYAERGYDFLAISDHDRNPDPTICASTFPLIVLPGLELSAPLGHLLIVGSGAYQPLHGGVPHQTLIDRFRQADALVVLCHPDWGRNFNHYSFQSLAILTGFHGIEIFNGSILEDPGSPYALEKWDQLLADQPLVWGVATDDGHGPSGVGRGWCMVQVPDRTPHAILESLKAGRFYASTGVHIDRISANEMAVRVEASDAEAIAVIGEGGRQLAWAESPMLEYHPSARHDHVFRFECYGRANRKAWTQPFVLEGSEIERRRVLLRTHPTLCVPLASRAPVLRGDLSDPAWLDAATTESFLCSDNGRPADVRTELRCLVAEGAIYLGIRCEEPLMERLKVTVTEGHSQIWTDDSMELFLDTEGKARRYFHLMLSPLGVSWACEQGEGVYHPHVPAHRVCAARGSTWYAVECLIPLAELRISWPPSHPWRVNVVRNRHPVRGRYTWSFVGDSNHAPDRFGYLTFCTPSPG